MELSFWYLVYAGLGLIVLELLIGVQTGFDLILIGVSLLLGGLVAWLTGNFQLGIVASICLSFLYFVLGRKHIKEKLFDFSHKINVDKLIDKQAIVVKAIKPHQPGQVKIEGEVWRAESDQTIGVDQKVKIISVEGVTLKVIGSLKKVKNKEAK
ncbi:MAG: NfeD family protein [Patescibacteria group bacterium]